MHKLKSKKWWHAAGTRAIKTFFQTGVATAPTAALLMGEVDWLVVGSASLLAAVLSLGTSLAGLPEVHADELDG